jgi:ATP-dependent Lon protease
LPLTTFLAAPFVSPQSLQRFATFRGSLPPSIQIWIEHQARIEAQQPVHNVAFMRATIRQRFATSRLGNATIDALLAVLIQQVLQSANNEGGLSQTSQLGLRTQLSNYNQMEQILSNLLKSLDDTQSSVIQNMKG